MTYPDKKKKRGEERSVSPLFGYFIQSIAIVTLFCGVAICVMPIVMFATLWFSFLVPTIWWLLVIISGFCIGVLLTMSTTLFALNVFSYFRRDSKSKYKHPNKLASDYYFVCIIGLYVALAIPVTVVIQLATDFVYPQCPSCFGGSIVIPIIISPVIGFIVSVPLWLYILQKVTKRSKVQTSPKYIPKHRRTKD